MKLKFKEKKIESGHLDTYFWPPGCSDICSKNFNIMIFLDAIIIITVELCMMVVLIELYPFTPFLVTVTLFQGHKGNKKNVVLLGKFSHNPLKCVIVK